MRKPIAAVRPVGHCRLTVEVLEDRRVLSLLGRGSLPGSLVAPLATKPLGPVGQIITAPVGTLSASTTSVVSELTSVIAPLTAKSTAVASAPLGQLASVTGVLLPKVAEVTSAIPALVASVETTSQATGSAADTAIGANSPLKINKAVTDTRLEHPGLLGSLLGSGLQVVGSVLSSLPVKALLPALTASAESALEVNLGSPLLPHDGISLGGQEAVGLDTGLTSETTSLGPVTALASAVTDGDGQRPNLGSAPLVNLLSGPLLGLPAGPSTKGGAGLLDPNVVLDSKTLGLPLVQSAATPSLNDIGSPEPEVGLGTQAHMGTGLLGQPFPLLTSGGNDLQIGANSSSAPPDSGSVTVGSSGVIAPQIASQQNANALPPGPTVNVGAGLPVDGGSTLAVGPVDPQTDTGQTESGANAASGASNNAASSGQPVSVNRNENESATPGALPSSDNPPSAGSTARSVASTGSSPGAAGAAGLPPLPSLALATQPHTPVDPSTQRLELADALAPLVSASRRGPAIGGLLQTEIRAADNQDMAGQATGTEEDLSPESSRTLAEGNAADMTAMERALQQFLDHVAVLPDDFGGFLKQLGPVP